MSRQVIEFGEVDIGFAGEDALIRGVNFTAHAGEVIGLAGVSGVGKTTLLRTFAGLQPPLDGEIKVLNEKDFENIERGAIGYIPQRLGLVNHKTVGYNVLLGALPHASWWQSLLSLPSRQMRRAAREAVSVMGLSEKMAEPISQLSGGQQRRVAVARSLVQKPKLLLADECLGELDVATGEVVAEQLLHLAREHETCVILVDHNLERLNGLCDRVIEMTSNGFVEDGLGSTSPASGSGVDL